ncbi:MAG: isocitrate/isopropylmalate family dehydrogenase [Candidatus Dormibacteraeota bacterium]|nr:isocitrate/isopropylmalate family dehydrogenase [Candidatus Dormibacteraeota bacterium]
MTPQRVTLVQGDGVGPQVIAAACRVLEAVGARIEWEPVEVGALAFAACGDVLPEPALDSFRRNGVGFKGPLGSVPDSPVRSVNAALRQALGLYAMVRPLKLLEGARSRYHPEEVDVVVVRETQEDVYMGIELPAGGARTATLIDELKQLGKADILDDSGLSVKAISRSRSRNIVDFAFRYAEQNHRQKVTAVHMADIMRCTDGLFLAEARKAAEAHPRITFEEARIDNLCMQLVTRPDQFDVLVLPNLYGDIVSDIGAGLIGGIGSAPGSNVGDDCMVFESAHGPARKYTGLDRANPTAVILSGAMLLRHIGQTVAADRVERAVADVIRQGIDVTYDVKWDRNDPGVVGTSRMADAVIERLEGGDCTG